MFSMLSSASHLHVKQSSRRTCPLVVASIALALVWPACGPDGEGGGGEPGKRLLVITTEPLYEAAAEYAAYRESRGFSVTLVTTQDVLEEGGEGTLGEQIKARVARWAKAGPKGDHRYLLIIADASVASPEDPLFVPVHAGEESFVGDFAYGGLDEDVVPDIAIGRLPFREPAAVEAYLERVRAFEEQRPIGPFNRRLSVFAGEGGFGPEIDAALEWVALRIFESLSYDFDMSMTYAASSSSYYLPPEDWDADYVTRYNAGSTLQPYIGHTLGGVDTGHMRSPVRPTVVAYLSCSDGEYHLGGLALTEELLLMPEGPLGGLAASDWSHPYGNAIMALELSMALFNDREPTYGRALQVAKQRMVYPEGELRTELEVFAEPFLDEPADHLARTHVILYNLMGDPTIGPGFPEGRVTFDGPQSASMGQQITVSGRVTADGFGTPMSSGQILVTLECERGAILGELVPVQGTPSRAEALQNHEISNYKVLLEATVPVTGGAFSASLELPTSMKQVGYYLKGYAWAGDHDAMGSRRLPVYR